jgi:diacylglycerol O-acyltransferase / wax synthase
MAQRHLDRLSSIDASFLTNETSSAHMHVGAVTIFEGPPPSYDDFIQHVESRLHLVPRFRQKLAFPPIETGRPFWVDDPTFNISYHVRHSALPSPGSEEQLRNITGRLFSQALDRSKPLWEIWLVQGLEKNRFALITKTHHALVDGVAGVDIATVLFDVKPVPDPIEPDTKWVAKPQPSTAEMGARGISELAETPFKLAERAMRATRHPRRAARKALEAGEALAEVAWNFTNPAPDVPLNVEIGSHRRFAWSRAELDDYKRIKNTFGGTVNDVVLTVVSGALRRWLQRRGIRTQGLELRALVPVSIRTEDEGHLGNRIAAMRGPLPVYVEDPVKRLQVVRAAMDGLKESKQALGAEVISRFNDFAPPTLLAQASRINFSTRLFNLIVTNVPGPQIPLYILGRELQDVFPVAFLPENHAMAIAVMSYNGGIDFGLLADYDSMEDVDLIADSLSDALTELLEAADSAEKEGVGAGQATEADLAS